MEKKLIEAVCTANNGRSPLIEIIGRNHLVEIGADGEYDTISSGTLVDAIAKGGFSIEVMSPYIDIAVKRGDIYNPQESEELNAAMQQKDQRVLGFFYNQAVKKFIEEEHANKAEALKRFGIKGLVKTTNDQTVARDDVTAVLTADSENYGRVLGIYQPTQYAPTIAVLSKLASGDPKTEMKNAFGKSKDYMIMVERMLDDVPKAINRIVKA
jgi:hypothetical protein